MNIIGGYTPTVFDMQKSRVVVLTGKEYNTIISNAVEDKECNHDKSRDNKIAYQCISTWKEMLNTVNSYDPWLGAPYCLDDDDASTILFEWPKINGNISGIACHSDGRSAVVNFSKGHVYIYI